MAFYNYIAVEGPIGAGKSIVAGALAKKLGARLIESPVDENLFIVDFYRDPRHYAFSSQIFFLLSRYRLLSSLLKMDLFHQSAVSDFVFERDELYAKMLLTEAEFRLYRQVEKNLRRDIPDAQLVVFLQSPVENLVRNISTRGRDFERKYISEEFLSALTKEYTEFFFRWEKTPLLVVDVGTVDISDAQKLDELVSYILSNPIKGVQYYSSASWI